MGCHPSRTTAHPQQVLTEPAELTEAQREIRELRRQIRELRQSAERHVNRALCGSHQLFRTDTRVTAASLVPLDWTKLIREHTPTMYQNNPRVLPPVIPPPPHRLW